MTADVRIWIGTVIAGLIVAGLGVADFVTHNYTLSALDVGLVGAGASLIAGKAVFDLGVQVPTPPKV
jgi:hypothetical protein